MKSNNLAGNTLTILAVSSILFIYSCSDPADMSQTKSISTDNVAAQLALKPQKPKPEWGKELTDPMAVVIEKLASYNTPPLMGLSPGEARKQPSPADAANAVIREHHIPLPQSSVEITNSEIPVEGSLIQIRIYTPKTAKDINPVVVYFHGGGWVIANLDTYNASAQAIAEKAGAVVVSVAYRQAPEYKFPTAHHDCFAAYEWVLKNAPIIKGDPHKIALVGESAGGNLAAGVCLMARDKGLSLPVHEVLVYPIAGYNFSTKSYDEAEHTMPLNAGLMKWFFGHYLNSSADGKNPLISLVDANLKGMPATTIIAAQYDPLLSEGQTLADHYKSAGVSLEYKLYPGTTHEFFGMAPLIPEAQQAQALAGKRLKDAFK